MLPVKATCDAVLAPKNGTPVSVVCTIAGSA
jgi:hypothetical protein